MSRPVMRAGLRYGLVSGVIGLLATAYDIAAAASLPSSAFGLQNVLIDLIFSPLLIYSILAPVFAGRAAARQTGLAREGVAAGVVVCVVSTLVTLPGTVAYDIVAPHTGAFLASNGPLGGLPLVLRMIAWLLIGTGLSVAFGALLGALGGRAGRRVYRRGLLGEETPSRSRAYRRSLLGPDMTPRRRLAARRLLLLSLALLLLVVGMCLLGSVVGR